MSTSPESGAPAPVPEPTPTPGPQTPAPLTLEQLLPTARWLVAGFAWGAVMLVVLGFWLRSKNDPTTRMLGPVFLVGGAISAALAIWQAFTLWFQQAAPAQKTATLYQQRRILGYVLLIGGLVLVGFACYLGIGKKGDAIQFVKDNLAESIGVLLFGIIALGSGYLLTLPGPFDSGAPIRSLVGMAPALKLLMLIVGAVAIVAFIAIAYQHRANRTYMEWIPELAALVFLSVLCLSCVIWLNTGQFDEVGMRVFVLVFGGSLGGILFVYAVARAYLWRQDIFLGGIPSWQGATAWRFWLVAYIQIVALILMFVSFNLARTDIRANVTLRRVMYGYDTILQALLLVEVLAVGNVVIYALMPFTYDWTKTRGAYSLADSSKNLIAGLKKEINVVVLMRQGNPIYKDLHTLLDNCEALNSTKFKVQYVSPEAEPTRYDDLVKAFPKIAPESFSGFNAGVLIIDGTMPKPDDEKAPPYAFVASRKLADVDRRGAGEKSKQVFKGEAEILKEVKFLVLGKEKRKIYFLQGNGEADINNKEVIERRNFSDGFADVGIGLLVERLNLDGYEVSGLSFASEIGKPPANVVFIKPEGNKKEVPADCETLIIAGASEKLPDDAIEGIERYLSRGKKMIVFTDVIVNDNFTKMKETGLEPLLRANGVQVTDDFPLRLRLPIDPRDDPRDFLSFPPRNTTNALAREFSRPIIIRKEARILKQAEGPGARYKADPILEERLIPSRNEGYIIENKVGLLKSSSAIFDYYVKNKDRILDMVQDKPIPIALAVTEEPNEKPRLVVFGDTEFITNSEFARSPTAQLGTNYSFLVSSIEWLAGREEMIGTQPKESLSFRLGPDVNDWRMIFLPGWIMLLSIVGLGVGVWMVRRR